MKDDGKSRMKITASKDAYLEFLSNYRISYAFIIKVIHFSNG